MAWSGTYSQKIVNQLNNLSDSKYDPIYDPDINRTADAIKNYGDYASKYQPQIDDLSGKLYNWNYDPEGDVSYQAYKQQYTDLGNRAMKDTLGQVSARTGGLASSYAGSAAQQSYNGYMQQLANIIPQLEQQAFNRTQANLNMYQGMDNTDYSRWREALNNLYAQNNMYLGMDQNAFNRYSNNLSNQQAILSAMQKYDDEEYARYQDALAAASRGSGGGGGGYGGGYYGTASNEPDLMTLVQTAYNTNADTPKNIQYAINAYDAEAKAKQAASTWLKTQEAKKGNTTAVTEQNAQRRMTGDPDTPLKGKK